MLPHTSRAILSSGKSGTPAKWGCLVSPEANRHRWGQKHRSTQGRGEALQVTPQEPQPLLGTRDAQSPPKKKGGAGQKTT